MGEVVDRHLNRFARAQGFEVIDEEIIVERVRVVEVDLVAQL